MLERLARRDENFYTYLLSLFLEKDHKFFSWFINDKLKLACRHSDIENRKITPQKWIESGVPDIEIDCPHLNILIEAKIQAKRTPNQPESYLKHLYSLINSGNKKRARLVFIHYEKPLQTLREEVSSKFSIDKIIISYISWEDIADYFVENIKYISPDNCLRAFQYEFGALILNRSTRLIVSQITEVEQMALSSKELGETIEKILDLNNKLMNIFKNGKNIYGFKLKSSSISHGYDWLGFYLANKARKTPEIWIGFFAEPWSLYGESPIWLQIDPLEKNKKKRAEIIEKYLQLYEDYSPKKFTEIDPWCVAIPLKIDNFGNGEKLIKLWLLEICDILKRL